MIKPNDIYKCNICGNIVELLHNGNGKLVCCGESMEKQIEKEEEEGTEKHIPVFEKNDKTFSILVGKEIHPMEGSHYIEWIEVFSRGKSFKKFLKPGDYPSFDFENNLGEDLIIRSYCNVHGLWKLKI
jgi:superoxide reductase